MTTANTLLMIEDEAPIRRFLRIILESEGFTMLESETGREGIALAAKSSPDLILLDLGLPDMDGKGVVKAVREWSRTPILVLSVRDSEHEKIAALDAGADDYVTKPFSSGELLARIRALLRSRRAPSAERSVIAVGAMTIDLARRLVVLDGADIKLTRKEFDVLAMLGKFSGRLVTHAQILEAVWGRAHINDTHYLRIAIGHLRDKLGDDATNPMLIINEPGVGYRLAD